jgi:hypothetical protein
VGFLVDKVELGQVFSEYFGFHCQFSFHQMLHTHLSSGAGAIGQLVPDVPSGLIVSLTPLHERKKAYRILELNLSEMAMSSQLHAPFTYPSVLNYWNSQNRCLRGPQSLSDCDGEEDNLRYCCKSKPDRPVSNPSLCYPWS